MGTKANPGAYDCYAAAHPDEPMFVLLGRDKHAAALVNLWAAMRRLEEGSDEAKIAQAEQCANEMVHWLIVSREGMVDPAGIRALAEGLAVMAEMCGAVVTIEQEPIPGTPLAMGNYRHTVSVRAKRVRS